MNLAAVLLFALSAASLLMGVGFGIAVGEDTGTILLVGAGLASAAAGLGVVSAQGRDVTVRGAAQGASALPSAGASVWPFGMGLAALVVATGLATGSGLVYLGLAAAAVAGVGWFAQSWASHPTWTDEQNERVSSRLIMPLALPLGVTALVVLLAVAFSRILLAVDKNSSVLIALVAALVILGGGILIATRSLGRSAVLGILTVGALVTAGLGVGGAVAGEREFHAAGGGEHAEGAEDGHAGEDAEEGGAEHAEEDDHSTGAATTAPGAAEEDGEPEASSSRRVQLSADNLAFDKESLTLPAGEPTVIEFSNEEAQPHNVAIRDGAGETVFRPKAGGIITGPGKEIEYEVPPIEAGQYTFVCEVHPQMEGQLTVV